MEKKIVKYKLSGIEIWDTDKIKPQMVKNALKIKEGDLLTAKQIEIFKKRAEKMLKKNYADFSSIMMPRYKREQQTCLTIDFKTRNLNAEKNYVAKFNRNIYLPSEISALYKRYENEQKKCFDDRKRKVGKFLKDGFQFSEDAKLRKIEEQFIKIAQGQFPNLKEASQRDRNPRKRAIANFILGWHPDRKKIIDLLESNFYDPNFEVKNNAALSLIPIINESRYKIKVGPILDLLAMPSGLARNKALAMLYQIISVNRQKVPIKGESLKIIEKSAKSKQINHNCFAKPILDYLRGKK